ncbi:MAG: hypothetical protein MJ171_08005, partial [Clostridia bacterium]|nr:hypothetical protein [Clostridia bacterium]
MGIREIDDRYPEFASTKGKTGKKHKYKKLSMKDKMVTKILAMSVAGAVVLDAGATAISNEINGDDSPGFFMGIFEQEPAKIAPRLENESTQYAKKKVTVEFDLVPNDMDTVLDIHLDLLDETYPVTLDENFHGTAVIDVDLPDGDYDGLIVCDYLMKKEAEIAIPFAFTVTIPKPLELLTYNVSYDHD